MISTKTFPLNRLWKSSICSLKIAVAWFFQSTQTISQQIWMKVSILILHSKLKWTPVLRQLWSSDSFCWKLKERSWPHRTSSGTLTVENRESVLKEEYQVSEAFGEKGSYWLVTLKRVINNEGSQAVIHVVKARVLFERSQQHIEFKSKWREKTEFNIKNYLAVPWKQKSLMYSRARLCAWCSYPTL